MFKSMTTNLMVTSVDTSLTFYTEVLGFTLIDSVPGGKNELQFAILGKNQLVLMLQERENLISEFPSMAVNKVQPSITLYIEIDNFADFYAELTAKKMIAVEMHTTFYGSKEFAVADPDGYMLTFTEAKNETD